MLGCSSSVRSGQVERQCRAAQPHHLKQIGIFDQRKPIGLATEDGQVVADFEHAARNCSKGDRDFGLVESKRRPDLSLFNHLLRHSESIWIAEEEIVVHVIARGNARGSLYCARKCVPCPVRAGPHRPDPPD